MAERPTVRVIGTWEVARKSSQEKGQRSALCLTWSVDPATGKLVARWVVAQEESTKILRLSSAA
jgi:hypothetical protein